MLYSLVQICTLAGVPPFEYVKDVSLRTRNALTGQLTPQGWGATFRSSVAA